MSVYNTIVSFGSTFLSWFGMLITAVSSWHVIGYWILFAFILRKLIKLLQRVISNGSL